MPSIPLLPLSCPVPGVVENVHSDISARGPEHGVTSGGQGWAAFFVSLLHLFLSCLFSSIHSMNFQKYLNPSQSSVIFSVYLVVLPQSFTYPEYERGICGIWLQMIDNIKISAVAVPQKLTFPPFTVAAFLHSSSLDSFLTNFQTVCISLTAVHSIFFLQALSVCVDKFYSNFYRRGSFWISAHVPFCDSLLSVSTRGWVCSNFSFCSFKFFCLWRRSACDLFPKEYKSCFFDLSKFWKAFFHFDVHHWFFSISRILLSSIPSAA